MPHQFMSIDCKQCNEHHCPVCNKECPKCGTVDVADSDTEVIRSRMRLHMNRKRVRVSIIHGDITTLAVDAIVNAANHSLLGGGGVDGAIHRAAGPQLRDECATLNGCATGQAKITKGYNLPARFVIHTVGPVWGERNGEEPALLDSCYTHALELAHANSLRTVAFPAISTGAFGYPPDEAAVVANSAVRRYIATHPDAFDEIIFVQYTSRNLVSS